MTSVRASVTRASSSDSSASSNIQVSSGIAEESGSERPAESTPPTSVSDHPSMDSGKAAHETVLEVEGRRPRRARNPATTYNLKTLSDAQQAEASARGSRKASGLSGRTLVDGNDLNDETGAFRQGIDKAMDTEWEIPVESPNAKLPARPTRKPSIKDRVKNGVRNAIDSGRSALAKRARGPIGKGKRKRAQEEEEEEEEKHKNRLLKELDTGPKGWMDEIDLDENYEVAAPVRPVKRARTAGKEILKELAQPALVTGPLQKTSDGKRVKKWQTEGLYVGQEIGFDQVRNKPKNGKLQRQGPQSSHSGTSVTMENEGEDQKKPPFMPLPMFSYLDKERSFTIPFDVFAPSLRKGDEKPKDWHKMNRNRLIGEAKDLWESEKLPASTCVCDIPSDGETGCGEDCLNVVMQYECNNDNCNLGPSYCSNRQFAELGERIKKGGSFDVGVEVVKTDNRGFGIRSARSFRPQQIIMEYTGEIISEAECQRRMREDYKDRQCYYLMELEKNLVIDGTKGSMARFINHSCEPNCEVKMLKVNGTPRMAVFAGTSGVMTGEELTYDYNFDNFGETRQRCFCGAQNCRGFLSKRLNSTELKKQIKIEQERKRKAAEAAQKAAEEEQRRKKVKTDRGSAWRGWVAVDDPETKQRLREEKRQKVEAEKNSSRAQRLAARVAGGRRNSLPPTNKAPENKGLKKTSPKKRQTIGSAEELTRLTSNEVGNENAIEDDMVGPVAKKAKHLRKTSTGSRFTEELALNERPVSRASRPGSRHSGRGIVKKTTYSVRTSLEIQRTNDTIHEDEDAALAAQLSGNKGRSSSRVASHEVDRETEENVEDEVVVKPNAKRSSILGGLSKAFGNGGSKLKQTTLSFGKK